ncbi:MAG: hypothetical protein NTX50_20350 [Candidatus Sumerlaeota bacterium]|nr:hypothetical protein [Candidatus Sumerlaeota bacterium]
MLNAKFIKSIIVLMAPMFYSIYSLVVSENTRFELGSMKDKTKFLIYNPYIFKITTTTAESTTIESCIQWRPQLDIEKKKSCFTSIAFLREEDFSFLPFSKYPNRGTFSGKYSDSNNWCSLNNYIGVWIPDSNLGMIAWGGRDVSTNTIEQVAIMQYDCIMKTLADLEKRNRASPKKFPLRVQELTYLLNLEPI